MARSTSIELNFDYAATQIEEILQIAHDMEADYSSRYSNLIHVLQRSSGEFATRLKSHLEAEKETAMLTVQLMVAYANAMKRTMNEIQEFDKLQSTFYFRL